MVCLRASLSPAARTVYKYSLDLSEADLKKRHSVVNALREYYGAKLDCQGSDKSSFAYYNKKMSRSRHGRREYEIKRHNAHTKTLRTYS